MPDFICGPFNSALVCLFSDEISDIQEGLSAHMSQQNWLGDWNPQTHGDEYPIQSQFQQKHSSRMCQGRLGCSFGQIQGTWSLADMGLHMKVLELKATGLICMAFLSVLQNSVVQVFTDNMTALYYINKGIPGPTPCAWKPLHS